MIKPKNASKKNFLRAADFEQGVMPPKDFALVAERLEIDGESFEDVLLKANYDRHLRLNFSHEIKGDVRNPFKGNLDINLSGKMFGGPVPLLATLISSNIIDSTKFQLSPSTQPVLCEFGKGAIFAEAVLINGPPLYFRGQIYKFDLGEFDLKLSEFPRVWELRKSHTQ